MDDTPLPPPTTPTDKEQLSREEIAERAHRAFVLTGSEMFVMPVEQKANTQLSLLTQGIMECMSEASVLTPKSEAETSVWKTPDARRSVRHAELQDMARLSEASARILDAFTRYRRMNSQQIMQNHVVRKKAEDGSTHVTTIRHAISPHTWSNDFVVDEETMAALRARHGEPAAAKPAEG